jgi:hypothetical protein
VTTLGTDHRDEILRELREHHALLEATPARGFDTAKVRDGIKAEIDGLLELLYAQL